MEPVSQRLKFFRPETLAAYNADNGTSLTSLDQVSSGNRHWKDNTYDSVIFSAGNPNYVGTVGAGNLQDLLMEPIANFSSGVRRVELTNVDVAALRDLGWATLSTSTSLPGDVDGNGVVDIADFGVLAFNFAPGVGGKTGAQGDLDGDGVVGSSDFGELAANLGNTNVLLAAAPVPEPGSMALVGLLGLVLAGRRRRSRD